MIAFFRQLFPFVRPYRGRLLLGTLCGVFYALSNAALMVAVKLVCEIVFPPPGSASTVAELLSKAPRLQEHLPQWLSQLQVSGSKIGVVLAIFTIPLVMGLRCLFAYLNNYLMNWVAMRSIADLQIKLFGHLQDLSLSFFHTARTGELMSRLNNDCTALHNVIATSFASMIKDPISVVSLVCVLLLAQPRLTLISLVVFPLCVVPIVIYGRKARKSVQAAQTHAAELAHLMQESFSANRIIKAYNLEATVLGKFRETSKKCVGQMMRIVRAQDLPSQLIEFFASVGIALVFLYVAFVTRSQMSDFVQFIGSIFLMYQPIKAISRLHNQLEQGRAASRHIFSLLASRPTVVEPVQPVPLSAAGADIHFDHVDFDYGEKPVLRDIHLTAKTGQLVALVGSSGSGKTTITNLLLRFYDPQKGSVRIGDTDIRTVSLRDLRNQIAVVTQETVLFNDTIYQNIGLGSAGSSNGEIEAAARHAHAHGFIMEKERGYATVIGERGVQLSGGQRQRLAIARAILRNAPILILDEATSALDTESERAVQEALEELMRGRTTICIAHRLSTIQKADWIVVLDQGRIVESGKHAELMARGGLYRKLHELQFRQS
jgi:subfamily B ATP-binding cassette protein MsbA